MASFDNPIILSGSPSKTLSKMNVSGIILVELKPKINIDICVCYLKTTTLSKGAEKLLKFAIEDWPKIRDLK
jgi:hypothetical protein